MEDRGKKLTRMRMVWRLANAGAEAFGTLGLRASVADIIARGGMSRRSFYEFFKSKEDLLVRITIAERSHFRGAPTGAPAARGLPHDLCRYIEKLVPSSRDIIFEHAISKDGMVLIPPHSELEAWYEAVMLPLPMVFYAAFPIRRGGKK